MGDTMRRGVIFMPYEMAMDSDISRSQYYDHAKSLLRDYEKMQSKISQLEKDAARYRWLRNNSLISAPRDSNGVALPLYATSEQERIKLDAHLDAMQGDL